MQTLQKKKKNSFNKNSFTQNKLYLILILQILQ